jgi:hypothetical protein
LIILKRILLLIPTIINKEERIDDVKKNITFTIAAPPAGGISKFTRNTIGIRRRAGIETDGK